MQLMETTQVTSWEWKRKPWNMHQMLRYFSLVQSQEHTASERKGGGPRWSHSLWMKSSSECQHQALQSCKPGQRLTDIFGHATILWPSHNTEDMGCLMISSAPASSHCLLISLMYLNRSEAMAVHCFGAKPSAEGQVCNSAMLCLATLPCEVKEVCVVTVENILLMDI